MNDKIHSIGDAERAQVNCDFRGSAHKDPPASQIRHAKAISYRKGAKSAKERRKNGITNRTNLANRTNQDFLMNLSMNAGTRRH
jgi:hypothetical protein